MATNTLVSPGILQLENDNSFITSQPIIVGAAIIGPTAFGPVETPTIVTSYTDYQNKFGSTIQSASNTFTYFTSIAAFNYFNNGGTTLLVSRVVSGAFTPATSSGIMNNTSSLAFSLQTFSEGVIMNNSGSEDANGALASGSVQNIRWQIANSNTSSGTFSLIIRRGDDITNNQIVLETWNNLSLDPTQPNFITQVIGNQVQTYNPANNQMQITGQYSNNSRYVIVASVPTTTPSYFDNSGNAKPVYYNFIPVNAEGGFNGAVGTIANGANFYETITSNNSQGIPSSSYDNMIALMGNASDYQFNILLTPGLFYTGQTGECTTIISNTQNRGDNIFVLDLVPFGTSISSVVSTANSLNTSYAASYWPWCLVIDPNTGKQVWVPASTMIGGVYAFNDKVGQPWFAPAGINRGGLGTVIRAEAKLSQGNRDQLYGGTGKVNPIAWFPGVGNVVYGQKTLQTQASALNRVNVRRLLISLKSYIGQIANTLVFEQTTQALYNQFLSQVNPYLATVQQKNGLYAFKVTMDSTNNTNTTIDENELVGTIQLKPTKTAEFIILNYNITTTGATFS